MTEPVSTPPSVDLKYVAWTVEETCHVIDPKWPTMKTMCGLVPRTGSKGNGRLKELLLLDRVGKRRTCERCLRNLTGKIDLPK